MKTSGKICCALCLAFTLAGCSTWDKLNNTERGAVIGTGTGAAVGSAVSDGGVGGAVVGGALGGVGGGLIGNEMDKDERREWRERRGRYGY